MNGEDESESEASSSSEHEGFVPVAQALELSLFTIVQLRALVSAGIIKTVRARRGGALLYNVEDLKRFDGMPRNQNDEDVQQGTLAAEMRAMSEGYKAMLDLALRQTKQAQDHERLLVTAFSKPLNDLGESSKQLVTAVLDQNKQLVDRANAGDKSRLDFVVAAESMFKDRRAEERAQGELDRKHELRKEMWDGVKKAAPQLLEGFKATVGTDRLEAAAKLKDKLDPDKVAALVALGVLDSEELDLLCKALGYDRADLERRAKEAREVNAADEAHKAAEPAAAE